MTEEEGGEAIFVFVNGMLLFAVRKPDGGQERDAVRADVLEPHAIHEHPFGGGADEELVAVDAGDRSLEDLAVHHFEADSESLGSVLVDVDGGVGRRHIFGLKKNPRSNS